MRAIEDPDWRTTGVGPMLWWGRASRRRLLVTVEVLVCIFLFIVIVLVFFRRIIWRTWRRWPIALIIIRILVVRRAWDWRTMRASIMFDGWRVGLLRCIIGCC
jgi:hypothetical protein